MNKFKVGDKVVRVSETYGKAIKGEVYEVSGVSDKGCLGNYGINLKGHEGVSGKFNYEASCFELYIDGVLSPLEAAEAMLNKDSLQIYDINDNKWYGFHSELRNITLEDLKHVKLRYKPKMVVINGVEVVAPMSLKEILECKDRREGYVIELAQRKVYSKRILQGQIIWATEEDAQKALDAMLIPFNMFNDLNKGEK